MPPKYELDFDEEEEVGLLGGKVGDQEPLAAEQHSYPPTAPASTGAPRSVVYHLRPKWPVSDDLQEQDAVSVVGRNRSESVALVIAAFPELRRFDEDRIQFLMPSDPLAAINFTTKYARITDAAWQGLTASTIRVEIADRPGEAQLRKRRETRKVMWTIGLSIGLPIAVMAIFFTLVIVAG